MNIFKTNEERLSAFMGCWQMAICDGDLTDRDKEQLARVIDAIGIPDTGVSQCLEHPETVSFVVPDNKQACLYTVKCLISVALDETGKISSVNKAKMLVAACESYGITDAECSELIEQLVRESASNQVSNDQDQVKSEGSDSEDKSATIKLAELITCGERAQLDQVLGLINCGANPDAKRQDGVTILTIACMTKQDPQVIEALIQAGADVHAENENGFTAIFPACEPFDVVTNLLASEVLRIETINVLLEAGADINHQTGDGPDPEDRFEQSHVTPLHAAVGSNSVDVVKFMLSRGAEPNICDGLKRTPLFAAVASGNIDLAHALIEGGADYDLTCIHCYNPETGSPIPVPFVYNGIDGEAMEIYPLDLAVIEEEYEIATMLHNLGAKFTQGLTQLELTMTHDDLVDIDDQASTEEHTEFTSSEWKTKENKQQANELWLKLKSAVPDTQLFASMGDQKSGELHRPTIREFPSCTFCISQHAQLEVRIKHGDKGEGTRLFEYLEEKKFIIENLIKEECEQPTRVNLVFERKENPRYSHQIKLITPLQEKVWEHHVHTSNDPVPPKELWDEIVKVISTLLSPFEIAMLHIMRNLDLNT